MARERMLVCDVADAIEKIPVGARCVSLKFSRDPAIKIGTTKDVLEQICRNVFSRRNISARLRDAVRSVNPGWLNVNTSRMKRPCRVSADYFVDLAGDDKAHFSRAARVLEWCGCFGAYARITYAVPDKGKDTGFNIKNGLDEGRSSAEGIGEYDSQWEEKYRIVCERFPRIVTFEEYINFFVDEFGLTRSTAINHIHSFFVRLDGERAIPVDVFAKKSSWSEDDDEKLESAVRDRLGSAPFLPLASLPESFFDLLPKVSFDGIQLKWTHELLEGIVWHLSSIPCTNYYAAWSLVSTYVVPEDVLDQDGNPPPEVEYILGIYCDRNPEHYSVEDAFNFLKENAVRIRLGRSLHKQIEDFLTHRVNRRGGSISGWDDGNGSQTLPARESDASGTIVPMPSLSQAIELEGRFKQDVQENYCNGFDFKKTSVRLVESRVGATFPAALLTRFKANMFETTDGLWFFPEMIISSEAMLRLVGRAKALLEEEGMFAIDSLLAEFPTEIHNLPSGRDFKKFFNRFVADLIGGKIRGHEGWRVCFRAETEDDEGWSAAGERVRAELVAAGDAVSVEDLLLKLPYLNREVILKVGNDRIADAVVFRIGEIEYLKLLEAFYLPEDFGLMLTEFVNGVESNQGIVSVVLLEKELDQRYGSGFRVNFGLEDEEVFKQVILRSYPDSNRIWKRDMLISKEASSYSNVAEAFLQTHDSVFHEEEFFRFAKDTRGMTNRGMLILTFLRRHCIRLSKEWWVSKNQFDEMFDLSYRELEKIGELLNKEVGNSVYKPISALAQSFYDALPKLENNGRVYQWNAYLLTSVAVQKITNARVVNDEPSPYTVTAIIVPPTADDISDVVKYVLGSFSIGYFVDADSAFDYLKLNSIRLTKTEKLMSKIEALIGKT